ncbi:unnamed protein product [Polarella glacialis]|nr:unnamed protein product [Polarella glacialis]
MSRSRQPRLRSRERSMTRLRTRADSGPKSRHREHPRHRRATLDGRPSERPAPHSSAGACLEALHAMQGQWVDEKGVAYIVEVRRVKRKDGRTFGLRTGRGFIDWGVAAKYYAVPSSDMHRQICWLDARTSSVAWTWHRPNS